MTTETRISNWLLLCCFMVFAMAVIGAVTRLTESGLSMTEWKPVTGALPPMSESQWQHQFDLYKQTPEYSAKHFWMQIEDFKKIFFWEWLHRLWGRTIGLIYALPLLWFLARKQLPPGTGWKFIGLLALGGLQGFVGWFMVKSGLVDRPSVSHFRLAVHLSLALLLFSLMLWLALDMRRAGPKILRMPGKWLYGWGVLALLCVTIVWGAFVAGLDAGMIYNTFPNMGTGLIPPDFGNIHSSPAGVQFTHRWLAISTFIAVMSYAWINRGDKIIPLTGLMALIQVGLGISTLLTQVNIGLAALHQSGAITLLALMIISQHRLAYGINHNPDEDKISIRSS
jgi:cytochrome c oxidase assembly protein subunit 15